MRINTGYLRSVIKGEVTFRKCPCCDINGEEWWDGRTGTGVGPSAPIGCSDEDVESGPCENCGGLAFIENTSF